MPCIVKQFIPALALTLCVLTGCSSNKRLEVNEQFPVPVMEKAPVRLGILLDSELLTYVHEEKIEKNRLSRHLLVRMHLTSGVDVVGHLSYLLPQDHERLQDYLNTERRFIPVHVDNKLTYINRDQVISVLSLRED